jgi:hypothetical protein
MEDSLSRSMLLVTSTFGMEAFDEEGRDDPNGDAGHSSKFTKNVWKS